MKEVVCHPVSVNKADLPRLAYELWMYFRYTFVCLICYLLSFWCFLALSPAYVLAHRKILDIPSIPLSAPPDVHSRTL